MRKRTMAAALAVAVFGGQAAAEKTNVAITIFNPTAAPQQNVYNPYGGYRQPVYQYQQPVYQYGVQQPYVDPNAYAVVTEKRKVTVGSGTSEVRLTELP